MKLADILKNKWYIIIGFVDESDGLYTDSRLYKLGIFPGARVMLRRKAPLFKDPLLFQVDDSQIVMTKSEASLIKVTDSFVDSDVQEAD